MPDKTKKKAPQKRLQSYLRYSGLGVQMIASVLFGTWLGQWIDERVAWEFPVFTIILALAFLSGSFYILIRDLNRDS